MLSITALVSIFSCIFRYSWCIHLLLHLTSEEALPLSNDLCSGSCGHFMESANVNSTDQKESLQLLETMYFLYQKGSKMGGSMEKSGIFRDFPHLCSRQTISGSEYEFCLYGYLLMLLTTCLHIIS